MKKILVLGLGNDIMSDDGVGIAVVQELERSILPLESVMMRVTSEMGLSLLDYLEGTDVCFIVDAIYTQKAPPGTLYELEERDLSCINGAAPHFLGIREVLSLGRVLGFDMPSKVTMHAIEVSDPFTVGTKLSDDVARAIPLTISRLLDALRGELGSALLLAEKSHVLMPCLSGIIDR